MKILLLSIVITLAAFVTNAEAEPGELLITAEQLAARDNKSADVMLDVRSADGYAAGHLPGALHVDVSDWKNQALAQGGLQNQAVWSERVGQLGITLDSHVVVYGGSPTDATRIWWTLKYLGVKQVSILDGGFDAWVDAGAPVSRDAVTAKAVDFEPEFQNDRLAAVADIRSVLATNSATVIDTRSDAEYEGTGGAGARKGHIPGAIHQEWTNFVTPEGRFKPVDEIRSVLKQQGLTPETKAITHCQTGGRASLNAFAMELAGYGPVKNYYCGWSEWSATKDAPIE